MKNKLGPPKSETRFGTPWGELEYVCRKVHYWLHEKRDRISARRYQRRLKRVLEELPQNDAAIVREEGLALLHELNNDIARALRHRAREIQLTERLHDSVRESRQAGEYDERMGASILAGRDAKVLRQRRAILKALITKQISGRQVDAVPAESRAGHETEGFSIDDLVAAKKLVGQVGSIEKVKEALAALARLS